MAIKTYDPQKIAVIFHGRPLSGFAKGTFVKVSRSADSFSPYTGSDGEAARTASADDSGEIEVTLMQTSMSNDYLSSELALDELTRNNTGPALLSDSWGDTLVSGDGAYLKKYADVTLADDIEARTWTIVVPHMRMVVGGNE